MRKLRWFSILLFINILVIVCGHNELRGYAHNVFDYVNLMFSNVGTYQNYGRMNFDILYFLWLLSVLGAGYIYGINNQFDANKSFRGLILIRCKNINGYIKKGIFSALKNSLVFTFIFFMSFIAALALLDYSALYVDSDLNSLSILSGYLLIFTQLFKMFIIYAFIYISGMNLLFFIKSHMLTIFVLLSVFVLITIDVLFKAHIITFYDSFTSLIWSIITVVVLGILNAILAGRIHKSDLI